MSEIVYYGRALNRYDLFLADSLRRAPADIFVILFYTAYGVGNRFDYRR